MKKVNLYDWLVAHDVVEWCKPLLEQAGWAMREVDGKFYGQVKQSVTETPWHHVKSDYRLKCGAWHQIYFDIVGSRLPNRKQFVPSKCHECFKVVVRPRTLVELFALRDLQIKLDVPSKCGIERRESVHGLYGGYFYNVGLRDGQECYHKVREEIDGDKYLGFDVPVFLKRACTEFEHACGDSDKWTIDDYQLNVEALLERHLVLDDIELKQPEKSIHHAHRRWIEWAYAMGDATYANFTGGKPLYPAYKTYEHLDIKELENEVRMKKETATSKKATSRETAVCR